MIQNRLPRPARALCVPVLLALVIGLAMLAPVAAPLAAAGPPVPTPTASTKTGPPPAGADHAGGQCARAGPAGAGAPLRVEPRRRAGLPLARAERVLEGDPLPRPDSAHRRRGRGRPGRHGRADGGRGVR